MEAEAKDTKKDFRIELDAMADFHARLSHLESRQVEQSRRITALEFGAIRPRQDDELFDGKTMGLLFALMLAPVVIDLVSQLVMRWRQQS